MKKIVLILLVVLSLTACNMQFFDNEGFTIFGYGAVLEKNQVLIQSHEGYVIDDKIYTENIFNEDIIIENKLNHKISVKITTSNNEEWVEINANDYIELKYAEYEWKY